MRRIDQSGAGAALGRKAVESRSDPIDLGGDEPGVIEERPDFINLRRTALDLRRTGADVGRGKLFGRTTDRPLGGDDIFQILPAAGIRAVSRGEQSHRPANAIGTHLGQRVGQQRMPVAISPVDRQLRAVAGQLELQIADEGPILLVDRALAAEMIIMLGDREHPLPGDVLAPQDVFQERDDLFRLFRSAERDDQYGIVRRPGNACHERVTPTGFEPVLSA